MYVGVDDEDLGSEIISPDEEWMVQIWKAGKASKEEVALACAVNAEW